MEAQKQSDKKIINKKNTCNKRKWNLKQVKQNTEKKMVEWNPNVLEITCMGLNDAVTM